MSRLFESGFDLYQASQMTAFWAGQAGTIDSTGSRWATGQGWRSTSTTQINRAIGSNEATLIVGFAAKIATPNVLATFFAFRDATTVQVSLATTATGALGIYRGDSTGTQLAVTSAGYVVAGVWHYYELKVLFNNSGTYELRVDGNATPVLSGSADTTNSANNFANDIRFGNITGNNGENDIDDIYLINTTGPPNNDFLGDTRVEGRVPTGAGNYAQFTPSTGSNWQNVDDIPPNDDTDYNYSSTLNQLDSFTHQALTSLSGTVRWVAHYIRARKDDAGTRKVAPLFRISSTDYVGSDDTLSTSYQYFEQAYETSPATSSAWTITEINNAEIGYKLTA